MESRADFSPWTILWLSSCTCDGTIVPASWGRGEGRLREGTAGLG